MANVQIFCYLKQVIDDLGLPGDEAGLFDRIKEASQVLANKLGHYIPVSEARTFDGSKFSGEVKISPLLSVTSVVNDGDTLTTDEYTLLPLNREWPDGPYSYILPEDNMGQFSDELVITGNWGKYSKTQALGINGTLATAVVTSLVVTNGSLLWPGMVLLIDSEQMLVEASNGGENSPDPTLATSQLAQDMDDHSEEVLVDNGAEFFQGEVLRLDSEDVLIRRKAGHILTLQRGWNNTTRAEHKMDCAMYVYRTATIQRGVNGSTAATHSGAAISYYKPPEDVNYLTRQIAALMRQKAKTGFSGRQSGENGEAFWINEFPSSKIHDIALNYKLW